MKPVRLFLLLLALSTAAVAPLAAQTGGPGTPPWEYWRTTPVPINDLMTAQSSIDIPDMFSVMDLQVMVDIDHANTADLRIVLVTPSGSYILSQFNGGSYDDYSNTVFDMTSTPFPCTTAPAATDAIPGIPVAGAPTARFHGVYQPEQRFTTGVNVIATGTWTIQVYDAVGNGITGVLEQWGLIFNRYGKYKDVRWGWDLNYLLNCGTVTMPRYPVPFVDDVTAYAPNAWRPYSIHGWRPQNRQLAYLWTVQNSKLQSDTKFNITQKLPNGTVNGQASFDGNMAPNRYSLTGTWPTGEQTGMLSLANSIYQRGDLFMTRDDNYNTIETPITPGTLAYDNGESTNKYNIPQSECDMSVYTIAAEQKLTSIDIWHSTDVELEPAGSPARILVAVTGTTGGIPNNTALAVAGTGIDPLPEQGGKWVTYAFNTPVTLPAGTYAFGICTVVAPTIGGVGMGVTQEGSPFDPEGGFSKLSGFGAEFFSPNGGVNWYPEDFRYFSVKMIRPNFILGSDVGVKKIEMLSSFKPRVTFGSYAHHPNLPNLITIGKVYIIRNSTGQTVGFSERRVYLQNAPYTATVDFDDFPGLAAGAYTVKVVIERSDDENLTNNTFMRTFNKTFAPVIVLHNGTIAPDLRDRITASFEATGNTAEFAPVSSGLPSSGRVLWIGGISQTEAASARAFASIDGNEFMVLPNNAYSGDVLTSVYSAVATPNELDAVNRAYVQQQTFTQPSYQLSEEVARLAENPASISMGKTQQEIDENARNTAAAFDDLKVRLAAISALPKADISNRPLSFATSKDISVEAARINDISIVSIVPRKSLAPRPVVERISTPSEFELTQNYPNPFNPTTNIAYNLPKDAQVTIRVMDLLGREIATLAQGTQKAGVYNGTWDGMTNARESVASGIYLYRFDAAPADGTAPFSATKRMVLAR